MALRLLVSDVDHSSCVFGPVVAISRLWDACLPVLAAGLFYVLRQGLCNRVLLCFPADLFNIVVLMVRPSHPTIKSVADPRDQTLPNRHMPANCPGFQLLALQPEHANLRRWHCSLW